MKSSIKIIKRKQDLEYKQEEELRALETPDNEKSVERSTREMTCIIKGWITELQEKKRSQDHSFPRLTIAIASQNS